MTDVAQHDHVCVQKDDSLVVGQPPDPQLGVDGVEALLCARALLLRGIAEGLHEHELDAAAGRIRGEMQLLFGGSGDLGGDHHEQWALSAQRADPLPPRQTQQVG